MGLIQEMAKQKGARAGVKLPVPTTAGDDQIIAAKTGEYFLPPAVVEAIGVERLDALVESITGQKPGGQPVEMPEGAMHEMMEGEMEGHAKGGCVKGKGMKGYATGGLISQFDGVRLNADPLQDDNQSLRKYRFNDGMGADSVATEVSRAAQGMPAADEVMQLGMDKMAQKQKPRPSLAQIRELESMGALGEDSNIMGFNKGGLISRVMGYNDGGIVEDEFRRRIATYNPQQTIRKPEAPFPRADELRNHNPQSTIRQPVSPGAPAPVDANALRGYNPQSTIPPNATTNASPRAPELRNFTPEPGRLQPGSVGPRIAGIQPQQGLISRVAQQVTPSRATVAGGLAGAGIAGAGQAIADVGTGYRDDFQRSMGVTSPAGSVAADAARTLATVGDAATFGLAGRVGRGIASATGGGSFGQGFVSPSDRERFAQMQGYANGGVIDPDEIKMGDKYREANQGLISGLQAGVDARNNMVNYLNRGDPVKDAVQGVGKFFSDSAALARGEDPQAAAPAPQLTPQQNSDEIARRRAALEPQPSFEQKIGKFIADERATPAPAAAAPQPKRGPVSDLAARAAKPATAAAPAASAIDPAVMADAQAAQSQLDQSPIARVVGGTGGTMTIQYKDGTTKQVGQEGMDEVNGFYGLTSRAAKQYAAQPVEIIAGNAGRAQAMPELGYQQVPDAIARSGKTGDYVTGLAQGALDRADPVAAEQRLLKTKTDEQIRAHRATDTDRGAEERGLRTQGLRLDLEEKKQVAELKKRAVAGDPQAIQQLNLLGIVGKGDTEAQKARYGLIGELSKAYAQSTPFDPETKQAIPFEQWAEPMLRSATGTVKSNSTPTAPQEGKTYTDAQGNKAVFRNGKWQEVR